MLQTWTPEKIRARPECPPPPPPPPTPNSLGSGERIYLVLPGFFLFFFLRKLLLARTGFVVVDSDRRPWPDRNEFLIAKTISARRDLAAPAESRKVSIHQIYRVISKHSPSSCLKVKKKQTKQNKEERKKGKRHIFYIATLFRVDRRSAVRQKDYRVFLFFLPSFSYLFLFTSFRNNRVCVLERRADRMERKKKKKKTKNRHQIKEHIVAKNQVGNVHPD